MEAAVREEPAGAAARAVPVAAEGLEALAARQVLAGCATFNLSSALCTQAVRGNGNRMQHDHDASHMLVAAGLHLAVIRA